MGEMLLGDGMRVVAKEVFEVLSDAGFDERLHGLDGRYHIHTSICVPDVERDIGRLLESEGPAPDLGGAGALVEVGPVVAGDSRHELESDCGLFFGFVGVFHIIGGWRQVNVLPCSPQSSVYLGPFSGSLGHGRYARLY